MINFFADKLHKRKYQRLIKLYCYHHGVNYNRFLQRWKINLLGLEHTDPAFYEHIGIHPGQTINRGIPSGVTGMFEINCFLHNVNNEMFDRENFEVITHELAHAVLIDKYGTAGGRHVSEVHNNPKRFKFNLWFFNKIFWKKMGVTAIDVRAV